MLKEAKGPNVVERITRMTMSCAHPESGRWEGASPNTHCGYCFPCIIRRAATHAAGTTDAVYDYDVATATFDATSKKARDQRAVRIAIERLKGQARSRALFDVLDSGPLEPSEARAYADVYLRGMDELAALLGGV